MTVRCACAQGNDQQSIVSYLDEVDDTVERHGPAPAKKQRVSAFNFSAMADGLDEAEKEETIIDMEDGSPLAGIADMTECELYSHVMRHWQSCRDTATRARLAELFQLYCAGQV